MTTTPQSKPNQIQTLVAGSRIARKRMLALAAAARDGKSIDDLRQTLNEVCMELANETYPMIEAHLEETTEIDGVVSEMVDQEGSYIDEGLMTAIMHSYSVATQLADEVKKLLPAMTDDLAKKRLGELTSELAKAIEIAVIGVSEAAVVDDEDEDDEDGDEESDEVTE